VAFLLAALQFIANLAVDAVLGIEKALEVEGVGAEAEQFFFNAPLLVLGDAKHSETESRFHTLGKTNEGRRRHITFTLRDTDQLVRVISARDMHRKERVIYEQAS
jgi:uncharacterized DUF497 family protein